MSDIVNRGAYPDDPGADDLYTAYGKINAEFAIDPGLKIHSATEKPDIIDSDKIGISDSEDANKIKRSAWSSIKAFLKSYFDTVYSPTLVSISSPTASFTLALTDAGTYIKANSTTAIVITVPPSVDVDFSVGTVITICQDGTGAVSVTQGSGVTLNSFKGLKVAGQRAALQLIKVDTDTWDVIGGIA